MRDNAVRWWMRGFLCGVVFTTMLGALGWSVAARAETGLYQICGDSAMEGHPAQDCIASLTWNQPIATDLVLTRPSGSSSEWAADTIWRQRGLVQTPTQMRTCSDDLTPPSPHGMVGASYVSDPCTNHVWLAAPPGQNVLVNCTSPTTNTDGSPIAGSQLPLKLYFYEGLMTGPVFRQISPAQSDCSYIWPNLEVGQHYFVVIAVDARGASSGSSNEATHMVLPAGQSPPSPPTGVSSPTKSMSDNKVYTIKQTKNHVSFTQVGTATVGTQCDETQPVIDKYVVNRDLVTWLGSVRPQVVVATCQ